jgi:hypothetical protein
MMRGIVKLISTAFIAAGMMVGGIAQAQIAKFGNAATFNGTSDYVNVGAVSELSFGGTKSFTVECWLRHQDSSYSKAMNVVSRYNRDVTGSWALSLRASKPIAFARETSPFYIYGTTPLRPGTWYHTAVTYDGTNARIYLNGELETEAPMGFASSGTSAEVLIGAEKRSGAPDKLFQGQIDEVRIWDYARSEQQLKSMMNRPAKGDESGLVGYWPMDYQEDLAENADGADDYQDLSASVNHGDSNGSPGIIYGSFDLDRDRLFDRDEMDGTTDLTKKDTDGDGIEDGVEMALSLDPASADDPTTYADLDMDGLPDDYDPNNNSLDADGDRFKDFFEVAAGSDPDDAASVPPLGEMSGDNLRDNIDGIMMINVHLGFFQFPNMDAREMDLDRNGALGSDDGVISLNYFLDNIELLPLR